MDCCSKNNQETKDKRSGKEKGILAGLIYGLVPHIGCIAFIVFSILGVTFVTSIFRSLLLNPYFFHILIALSFVFATISAIFYFKKQGFIGFDRKENGWELKFVLTGIKRKWKYLLTLYGTTIGINLLLFMFIFPVAANLNSDTSLKAAIIDAFGDNREFQLSELGALVTLQVAIPCPGHAPLIIGELKKISGVENVKFRFPNLFGVSYNPQKTSNEQILSLDVFNTYKATLIDEEVGQISEVGENTQQPQLPSNIERGCGGEGCGCSCGCRR